MKSNGANITVSPSPLPQVTGWHVLLVNCMANWTLAFMTLSINIAIPAIQEEMHLGAVAIGWLPLTYLLGSAIFLLPFGRIADNYGRRRMFIAGMVIFTLCSLAMVFTRAYTPFIALRAGQGLGASMVFAGSIAMVTLAYPKDRRGFAMGMQAAAAYLGQTMGPPIGGLMVHYLGWPSLFVFAAAFGALLLVLDVVLLRKVEWKEQTAKGFDKLGPFIYAPALFAFLLGMSLLPERTGIILTVAGVVGMVLFVWWQSRARWPTIEVGLFRHNRVFGMSNLAGLISYAAIWALTFLMSLYLQYIKGLGAGDAGLIMMTGVGVQAVFTPFAGRLSDYIEPRWVASWGMGVCALGLALFAFLGDATSYGYIIPVLCLLGLGYALFSPANMSAIMGSVQRKDMGVASASVATMRIIGQSISVGIATMIMAAVVGRHEIQPADYPNLLTAVQITFAILAVLCVVGIATSLARGKTPVQRGEVADVAEVDIP